MGEDLAFETGKEVVIDSPNFVIFIQGAWAAWNNPNNAAASQAITKDGIASVLLYDSYRDWGTTQKPDVTDEQWKSAFDGKNYRDELREFRAKIDYVMKTYHPKNLFISGNSYGGGLAALVAGDVPELQRVLLFSPQIVCPDSLQGVNIYREFPSLEEFSEAISRFKGELTIVRGNKDSIVQMEQPARLYDAAESTKFKRFVLLPADHSFSNAELYTNEHVMAFRS